MNSDLQALEFDGIRRLLVQLTYTPYGEDAARNLEPAPTIAQAEQMQASVTAAREALDAGEMPSLSELPDVRAALKQAASPGAGLSPNALFNLREILTASETISTAVEQRADLYPGGAQVLHPPKALLELLNQSLTDNARLKDDANEELATLNQEQMSFRREAEKLVKERMQRDDISGLIEDHKVAYYGSRAAISINQQHCDLIKGVRRGEALGGRDVVIEPMEAVAANNKVERIDGQVSAAQQKLLRAITDEVRNHLDALNQLVTAITWLDLAFAGGQLSVHMAATPPVLIEESRIELNQAYHPLLLVQYAERQTHAPVPLSISLNSDDRMLIITGPNTGGKTVVLKTIGLVATMAYCGLHVPSEGRCYIGNYKRIIVDVGDKQSLFHHLSTFAGHVEVMKRILEEADQDTLVLLDELGTGTDPEEGAALAMAMMDELCSRQVQGIVNTHLSPLKEYAEDKQNVRNASMLFDHDELKPTYLLQIGVPGRSLGLTIAERNGLPAELVANAREHYQRISIAKEG